MAKAYSDRFVPRDMTDAEKDVFCHAVHTGNKASAWQRNTLEWLLTDDALRGPCVPFPGSAPAARLPGMKPEVSLHAPDTVDDFYSTPMAWSCTGTLAVTQGDIVNLAHPFSAGEKHVLTIAMRGSDVSGADAADVPMTAVAWSADGSRLLIGTAAAEACILDAERDYPQLRCVSDPPEGPIYALAASPVCGSVIAAASRRSVRLLDVRAPDPVAARMTHHDAMACSVAWSRDGSTLATGGNDNAAFLWDARRGNRELCRHRAAAKALAWCPWDADVIATGGGFRDGEVSFWRASTGRRLRPPTRTEQQVTSIVWSPSGHDEVAVTFGPSWVAGKPTGGFGIWCWKGLSESSAAACDSISPSPEGGRVLQAVPSPDGTHVAALTPSRELLQVWPLWKRARPASHDARPRCALLENMARNMANMYALR